MFDVKLIAESDSRLVLQYVDVPVLVAQMAAPVSPLVTSGSYYEPGYVQTGYFEVLP